MTRLVFLTLYLLLATSYSTSVQGATEPLNSNVEFAIVHNLTTFLAQNLGAKPLYQLSKTVSEGPSTKLIINYTLGRRVGGDSLVGTGSGSQQWGSPQDVRLTINYPRSGVGAVVSFVFVTVEQSTNLGQGYVVSGGIGQRQISVVIEAKATLVFKYNAQIYGY